MHSTPVCNSENKENSADRPEAKDVSGIALFMVIASMGVLSILVMEFSVVAQVNARMAFNSLDQIKAHYLAKSGLKLSLLRLKAYQTLRASTSPSSGGGSSNNPLAGAIPKGVLEKIWNFPFMYPLPALPGMSIIQKDEIEEFQKSSGLEGKYSAVIESEGAKYNLNMLLAQYVGPRPSPTTSAPAPTPSPTTPAPTQPGPSPSPSSSFDPEQARKSLLTYIQQIMANRTNSDEEFAHWYRDYKTEDLVTNIATWADRKFNTNVTVPSDQIPFKRAPFYSLTELRMIQLMDDELYDLLAPGLTVDPTPGININAIREMALRALIPEITEQEAEEFIKYREDPSVDNYFKSSDEFWEYIQKNIAYFRGDKALVDRMADQLKSRNIRLVADETNFKITIQATVNQAVRTFEVWVNLTGPLPGPSPSPSASPAPNQPPGGVTTQTNTAPNAGLKITFMRIL